MSEDIINRRAIQWFPGHMAKTLRLMETEIRNVDCVLQILDARIPLSSLNPEIERITSGKPHLYIMNKADLADPDITAQWLAYFKSAGAGCLPMNSKQSGKAGAVKGPIEKELSALMERRRKKCRTLNEWDSQYQLHAKPVGEMRLNPDRLQAYDCEPVLQTANGHLMMRLGDVRIVSAALRWDPSSGKTGSDVSGLCLLLQDEHGRYYWHRSMGLQGAIAEFDAHDRICGGQVWAVCDMVEQFHIGRVVIETNGIGGHNPSILRAALKARRLQCGITEHHATGNKQKRILQALEGPLSSGLIWAHLSVLETAEGTDAAPVRELREFNPLATNQHDDHIDALAGAISDGPALIGKSSKKQDAHTRKDWRAVGGTHEVALDFSGG